VASRETAYAALFARLKSALPGMAYYGRRYYDWENVPGQPALIVVASQQVARQQGQGYPTVWELGAEVLLYAKDSDTSTASVDIALNAWVDQVEAALAAQPTETQGIGLHTTLGGVVAQAQLDRANLHQGIPEDQAVIEMQVSMLWPDV
jgi:hypothetical protein